MLLRWAIVAMACLASGCSASGVPIWEYLPHEEKLSGLFSAFVHLVGQYCRSSSIPDCRKMLTLYGMANLMAEEESVLDRLDPGQRDAVIIIWEKALRGKFEWPGWRSEEENAKEEFPGIQPVPNEISEDVESSGPSPHRQQQNTGVNRGGLLRPPGSEDVASRYPNAVWVKPDPTLMRRLSQEPGNAVPAPITLPQDPRNAVAATRALPQDPWNPVPAQKILPQNPRNIIPAPPLSPGSRNALFTPPLSPGSRNALFIPSFSHGSRKAPPTPGNFPHVRRNAFPKPPFPRPVDNRNPFSTFHR